MTFLHNERGYPGICSTIRACAQQPSGALCDAFAPFYRAFPRRSGGCVAYDRVRPPRPDRWDCRIPCPSTDVAVSFSSAPVVRPLSTRWFVARACSRGRWPRPRPRQAVRLWPRRLCYVSCPVSRDPWGSDRQGPPKTRLAHGAVGTLPFPVDATQFFAVLYEHSPDALDDTFANPSLHGAVNTAVVAKFLGQMIPLATTAHPKNDAVQCRAQCSSWPAGFRRRVQLVEDGLNNVCLLYTSRCV